MVLTQTLVDTVPSPEMLTRLVLWLWVVVMIPAVLSTLVVLVFGEDPAKLAMRTALRLLDAVTASLDKRQSHGVARQQADALGLVALRKDAQIADRQLREYAEGDHRLIETLVELLTLLGAILATSRAISGCCSSTRVWNAVARWRRGTPGLRDDESCP